MPHGCINLVAELSARLPSAVMTAGSSRLRIWTLLLVNAVAAAYVLPPVSKTATSATLSSRTPEPLVMLPSAVMSAGSSSLRIWTPSSPHEPTAAYVWPPAS